MLDDKIDDKATSERHLQALDQAYSIHGQLLNTITEMDNKIEEVIRCHEAQFLLAYRGHIKTMKEELSEIKTRGQEQEKKMMSNERSVFLQKQIILFREEALRLYDKLDEKSQQTEQLKSNYRQIEKVNQILEKQNKQYLRQIKILETQKSLIESQVAVLTSEKETLREELQGLKVKQHKNKISQGQTSNTKNQFELPQKYSTPKPRESSMPIGLSTRKFSRKTEPKVRQNPAINLSLFKQSRRMSSQLQDFQIKNFFVECIESIRRQVGQRKVYGGKVDDINNISSWQEFRTIDKLRLLEMFMQNQKLLVWMYQKIFPSRLNQIQSYLQPKMSTPSDHRSKAKSMQIQLDGVLLEDGNKDEIKNNKDEGDIEMMLPKVVNKLKKQKKYDVRGRIQMRNGKLSLSNMNSDLK